MILILFISYLIESGLDSVYYRFVPIDTNIFVPELKTTEEGGIFLTGTKSFTVNYGKEGLAFDQGMWINFEGRSGDVTVNGSISDEEGTGEVTRPLFEVENTRIGFAAPWGRGDFGDLDLYHHLNLGNYNQKGIGAELGIGPVSGGLLVSRGHYHQKRVFSEDHQGPYTVDDQGIIPGTEEVFLDGELMVKGVDYLIDYEGGTITFTPRQVITPIRRIEVRYLSGDLRFMKISSFSSARFKGNELGFILDDENKERTIDIDLSDEE
ncbi:MAG TPA: hypothetical protein EYP24_05200, partial [bacterium (Candidatus Stahlbacteria)]|nr:hypothetical protein [Candidatus Stahlbacteria bacterium]